jgi:hypothetical protein
MVGTREGLCCCPTGLRWRSKGRTDDFTSLQNASPWVCELMAEVQETSDYLRRRSNVGNGSWAAVTTTFV